MREPAQPMRIESRWPVALAIIFVLGLLELLPSRVRILPMWFPYLLVLALIVPMAAVSISTAKARWLRIERIVIYLFVAIAGLLNLSALQFLLSVMLNRSKEITGLQLLSSSIALWATNVLVFSLAYWRMDRGGPERRANHMSTKFDWLFPQEGAPEHVPPDWHPAFVDYLFLAFSTATAFSTTDVLPLTSRAKILMMLESTVSLVTIVTVAARAINILGS
jgi:uncharacterized membrane protein